MTKPIDSDLPQPESGQKTEALKDHQVIEDLQKGFAQALNIRQPDVLTRDMCNQLIHATLNAVPEIERAKIVVALELRGIVPQASGERHIDGVDDEQQNVLKDPDGLLVQGLRLSHSAHITGKRLELSTQELQALSTAAVLINSGKAKQWIGLQQDEQRFDEEKKAVGMLTSYTIREKGDYAELAVQGLSPEAISLLQENVRHDPSLLQTLNAKVLYYLLHSQDPTTGRLVPVEQRINASIHKHPIYGEIYKGYKMMHGKDLVQVHQQTVAEIEAELEKLLREKGYQFSSLKEFLNQEIQKIS